MPSLHADILARIQRIPVVEALGIRILEFREGYCRAHVPHDTRFNGVYETYHGGLLTTAADSVACFAICTLTGPDRHMTTTDITIRFVAPCLTDVTVHARVIKCGRTLCPVHVELFDQSDRLVAVAMVTYMLLDRIPHARGATTPGFLPMPSSE